MTEKTIVDVERSTTVKVWSLMSSILQLETDYKDRVKLTSEDDQAISNQILKLLSGKIK